MTLDETESPRARAKREQITDAARTLFLSQGYARTSMDAVTQAASVSKQTLYVYFPGKIELLAAIVTQELDALSVYENGARIETLDSFRTKLLTFAEAITGRLMQEEAVALLRLLVGEAIHIPELRSTLRQTFPARVLALVEAMLRGAHERKLIVASQPELAARMFVGPVMSFVALDGLFGTTLPTPPARDTLAYIVDAFLLTVTKGDRDDHQKS